MRKFPYITVGQILDRLKEAGLSISRPNFYKLEKKGLFVSSTSIGRWRVYSPAEAEIIVKLILENYRK